MSVWNWLGKTLLGLGRKVAIGAVIAILMEIREAVDKSIEKEEVLDLIDAKMEAIEMDLH